MHPGAQRRRRTPPIKAAGTFSPLDILTLNELSYHEGSLTLNLVANDRLLGACKRSIPAAAESKKLRFTATRPRLKETGRANTLR